MSGVDVAYGTETLREGGHRALGAGQAAEGATDVLDGTVCPPAALGVVAGAEALAAGVARAVAAHAALGRRVHAAHVDLGSRAGRTADLGDAATADTARAAAPGR